MKSESDSRKILIHIETIEFYLFKLKAPSVKGKALERKKGKKHKRVLLNRGFERMKNKFIENIGKKEKQENKKIGHKTQTKQE